MASKRKVAKHKAPAQQDMFVRVKPTPIAALSQRVEANAARMGEWMDSLTERVNVLDKQVHQLARAVDLLTKAVRPEEPKAAKVWSPEECIRLMAEVDVLLRCDGSVDWEIMAEIHDCTLDEVRVKVRDLYRKEIHSEAEESKG